MLNKDPIIADCAERKKMQTHAFSPCNIISAAHSSTFLVFLQITMQQRRPLLKKTLSLFLCVSCASYQGCMSVFPSPLAAISSLAIANWPALTQLCLWRSEQTTTTIHNYNPRSQQPPNLSLWATTPTTLINCMSEWVSSHFSSHQQQHHLQPTFNTRAMMINKQMKCPKISHGSSRNH